MDEIKDIVKKVFGEITTKTIAEQNKLAENFEKVCLQNKISGVKISGFKENHLYVNVDSSARLYQVTLIKNKMLKELQAADHEIQKISFNIGKV